MSGTGIQLQAVKEVKGYFKSNGKYDDAITQYTKYTQESSGDLRGMAGVKSCKLAKEWVSKPSKYLIDNMAIINSKYFDFAEAFSSKDMKSLIFTSTREESNGKQENGWTGQKNADLYEIKMTLFSFSRWRPKFNMAAMSKTYLRTILVKFCVDWYV